MWYKADGLNVSDNYDEANQHDCPSPMHDYYTKQIFNTPCPGCGEEHVMFEWSEKDQAWHIKR